ncbi:MAG: hypothetical protein WAO57_00410 [Syntrophomonadaceae bacterium]
MRSIIAKRKLWWAGALLIVLVLTALYHLTASPPVVIITCDSDNDGQLETYQLANEQVTVEMDDTTIWQSEPGWKVTDLVLADVDDDGQAEMLLVLWKYGSFGISRPMWMEGEDREYSNHLFVYRLVAGRMKPVWCSSAIEYPIVHLQVADYDGDGRQELLVTEGPSAGLFYSIRSLFYQNETIWQWQDWGFTLVE